MKLALNKTENFMLVSIEETRLDASVAPEFKQQMETVIQEGNNQIVLDISKITFMDSSSLGALVGVLKAMGNKGNLVIYGASGVVLELFKLTRMDRVFNLTDSLDSLQSKFFETV